MKFCRTLVTTHNNMRRLDANLYVRKGFGLGIDVATLSNKTGPWFTFSIVLGPFLLIVEYIGAW